MRFRPIVELRRVARRLVGVQPTPLRARTPEDAPGATGATSQAYLLHLQFIQDVITRLGNYGALIKGWSITFAGVMFGLSVEASSAAIALISIPVTMLFWSLDAYFLWSERCFRRLFADVRARSRETADFFMDATSRDYLRILRDAGADGDYDLRWRAALGRPTLRIFYGGTTVAAIVVAGLVWSGLGSPAREPGSPASSAPAESPAATVTPQSSPDSPTATPTAGSIQPIPATPSARASP